MGDDEDDDDNDDDDGDGDDDENDGLVTNGLKEPEKQMVISLAFHSPSIAGWNTITVLNKTAKGATVRVPAGKTFLDLYQVENNDGKGTRRRQQQWWWKIAAEVKAWEMTTTMTMMMTMTMMTTTVVAMTMTMMIIIGNKQ